MHPQRKFSLTLLASLALCYPTMHAQFDGGAISVPQLCVRYLVCFAVAKILVGAVANLYGSYADAIARAEEEAEQERLAEEAEREAAEAAERADLAAEALFAQYEDEDEDQDEVAPVE
jgi:hypothetical protein